MRDLAHFYASSDCSYCAALLNLQTLLVSVAQCGGSKWVMHSSVHSLFTCSLKFTWMPNVTPLIFEFRLAGSWVP